MVMRTIPLKDDKWRVFLEPSEYKQLLKSAYANGQLGAHVVRIIIRLMACSLRIGTVTDLEYGQFEHADSPFGKHWVVNVDAKDSTDREAETRPRSVFIPPDLMDKIHSYAQNRDLGPNDQLFPISKGTVHNYVKNSARNAGVATMDEDYSKISGHDLRRYFATHLLYRHKVKPAVVRALGGWKSDEAMFAYLFLPNDVLFEELDSKGLLEGSFDKMDRNDYPGKMMATAQRLGDLFTQADDDDIERVEEDLEEIFNVIEEFTTAGEPADDDSEDSSTNHRPLTTF